MVHTYGMTPNDRPTTTPAGEPARASTTVNVSRPPDRSSIWTASRVIALLFTVLEVLLLIRFFLKLLGANAEQGLVSTINTLTDPLVAPFRGVFSQPAGTPVIEIAALLAILFFILAAALSLGLVRALTGTRGNSGGA